MGLKPQSYFARWLHAFRLDGESERAFARRLKIEQQTLRRIYEGHVVHQKTLLSIASALNLPREEVFKHASDQTGVININDRSWLTSRLVDVITRLPESDQAFLLAEAIRLSEKHSAPD